jgi:hypothetical protein
VPISAFITSVGFIGAMVILRANHWRDYVKASGCATANALGQLWSYYAVALGILAIFIVTLTHPSAVKGIPVALFTIMASMALVDVIVSPILSLLVKVVTGRVEERSFLQMFDKHLPDDAQGKRIIINLKGQLLIVGIFLFLTIITAVTVIVVGLK